MEAQRERGRAASEFRTDEDAALFTRVGGGSEFLGYEGVQGSGTVTGIVLGGALVDAAIAGSDEAEVVLDQTPFYPEGGGQVGDAGRLVGPASEVKVRDTQRRGDLISHIGTVVRGRLALGDVVEAAVEGERRGDVMRNHTATHLLHAALRGVLGEHVRQAGSLVAADRLRFDYTQAEAPAPEQLAAVQRLVSGKIREDIGVDANVMSYHEAIDYGAMAIFGEKYGTDVRVIEICDPDPAVRDCFSKELCGGTHAPATGFIGEFQIVSEGSVGAGVRRIEALTGAAAEAWRQERLALLDDVAAALRTAPLQSEERVRALQAELSAAKRRLAELERKAGAGSAATVAAAANDVDGVAVAGRPGRGGVGGGAAPGRRRGAAALGQRRHCAGRRRRRTAAVRRHGDGRPRAARAARGQADSGGSDDHRWGRGWWSRDGAGGRQRRNEAGGGACRGTGDRAEAGRGLAIMAADLRLAADALVRHAWARLRTATAAGATWLQRSGGPGLSQYVLAAPAAATGAALRLRRWLGPILHTLARLAVVGGARGAHLAGLALAALGKVGRSARARASVARGGEDIGEATRVEIDAHDDLAAVRARLNQSAGAAVVLRARGGNSALASPLGMRLLRRHVDMTRLLVIIESRDGRLRRSARQHGMMIVPSMRGRRVEGGRLRAHRLGLGPVGIPIPLLGLAARAIVLASLMVVAAAGVLFLVPSTTVRLAPQLTPISVPISVIARVPAEGVPLGPGIIPARRYQATITVSDTIATTGFVEAPDAAARGVVRFQNQTAEAVELSPGTRATTGDGTIFFTLARVTLPAEAGSAVEAEVQAEEPGPGGNVAAGTVTQPDPLLGGRVTVTNPEPNLRGDDAPRPRRRRRRSRSVAHPA